MGAGGFLEAEKSTSLLVDPAVAVNGVPRVLHLLLDDTTWAKGAIGLCHLRIQTRRWQEWQSQIQEKFDHQMTSPYIQKAEVLEVRTPQMIFIFRKVMV